MRRRSFEHTRATSEPHRTRRATRARNCPRCQSPSRRSFHSQPTEAIRRFRAALILVSIAASLIACSAVPSPPPATSPNAVVLPPTHRDPLPFSPRPSHQGAVNETTGLSFAGGDEQARRLMPAFVTALVENDREQLFTLLGDQVGYLVPTRRRSRHRASLVQRLQVAAQRRRIPPNTRIDELLDLRAMQTESARVYFRDRRLPPLIQHGDWVVRVPIRPSGVRALRRIVGWRNEATMVVRPGPIPRIVAL